MNKQSKKILTLILALAMLLAVPTGVSATEVTMSSSLALISDDTIVTPNAWYQTKEVTEVRGYLYVSDAPSSIEYAKYDPNYSATFRGTLYLDSIVPKNGIYHATYKGTVGAYIF